MKSKIIDTCKIELVYNGNLFFPYYLRSPLQSFIKIRIAFREMLAAYGLRGSAFFPQRFECAK